MPDPTLPTLIRVSRDVIEERELVCPLCGDAVKLWGGRLWCCSAVCAFHCGTLAELAVRGEAQ